MKKITVYLIICALLCALAMPAMAAGNTIMPLPDTTMESLDNATAAISLAENGVYMDETGAIRMHLNVYTYDMYDLVDISMLEAGDTLVYLGEELAVTEVTRTETGLVLINGGLDQNGLDLYTDESGVYFAHGLNDVKSWYLAGQADYPVSDEFVYTNSADIEAEAPLTIYAGEFLEEGESADYPFIPEDTTVRIENGVIVAMDRVYIP